MYTNLTTARVTRCILCNMPVHRTTTQGVWACIKLHHWVECTVHGQWAFWSGDQPNDAFPVRACQCHRDDMDTTSAYVNIDWYVRGTSTWTLHKSEVIPRALVPYAQKKERYASRTRTLAQSNTTTPHILINEDAYTNSIFAQCCPDISWTMARALTAPL